MEKDNILDLLKDDYGDWIYVFKYGDPDPVITSRNKISLEAFTGKDVRTVISYVEGANDGPPWRMIGELNDGRFFYIEAGCDYTGWG